MQFTQKLFTSRKPANPFVPVSQEQILSDLAESRQQISDSKGLDMEDILKRMGKQHGFIWRNHLTKSIVSAEKARIPHHLMLYRIKGATAYVDVIYHQPQDYENTFADELDL